MLDVLKAALVRLTERAKAPGVMSLTGQSLESKMKKALRRYFVSLCHACESRLKKINLENGKEVARHQAEIDVRHVTRVYSHTLLFILARSLQEAMLKADRQMDIAKLHEDYNEEEDRDSTGKWVAGGAVIAAASLSLSGATKLIGTPYSKLNCSQFACRLTGHKKATAKQLYDEGVKAPESSAKDGDIVAYPHGHVAVMTKDGLMDSTPDRGVGFVTKAEKKDAWYQGDTHIVRGKPLKEAAKTRDTTGLSAKEAAQYAAEQAAKNVTGINDTTVKLYADAVETAIDEQLGVDGLARLLRDITDGMTTSRAEMIATTEIGDAFGEAALRKLQREEIEYKQLIPSPDACEICLSIVEAGPVPVDEPFVDDDGEEYDRSPIHPRCRCATVGARALTEAENG